MPRALVRLDPDRGGDAMQTTDSAGRFRFTGVSRGAHTLETVKIGYFPRITTVSMGDQGVEALVELAPLPPTLDTLRVIASPLSIVGTVFSEGDKRVIHRARVSLQANPFATESDTAGRFAFDGVPEGAYVLYVNAPGFLPYMLSLAVPREGAVQVAIAMRTPAMDPNRALVSLMSEFNLRTRTASVMHAALIPRQELIANAEETLGYAISRSPSFLKKGLEMDSPCVFVDGEPRIAKLLDDIKVADVEAVEVYAAGADWSQTLAHRWGGRVTCGLRVSSRSPRPPVHAKPVIQAVVVWLRK